jgi:hypothetical protein
MAARLEHQSNWEQDRAVRRTLPAAHFCSVCFFKRMIFCDILMRYQTGAAVSRAAHKSNIRATSRLHRAAESAQV